MAGRRRRGASAKQQAFQAFCQAQEREAAIFAELQEFLATHPLPAPSAPRPVAPLAVRPRGFAAMDPEKRRAYARQGGQHAMRHGKLRLWTPEEASQAGHRGGSARTWRAWRAKQTGQAETADVQSIPDPNGGAPRPNPR